MISMHCQLRFYFVLYIILSSSLFAICLSSYATATRRRDVLREFRDREYSDQEDDYNRVPNSNELSDNYNLIAEHSVVRASAAVAEKAVLNCEVNHPANDSIDLILWFRGDEETALYSLDARLLPINRAKHHSNSNDLNSRAFIDITGRPTSLVIESVLEEDAGFYKCRIDFRKARTEYRSIHLQVIVPSKEVIIMDTYGQRLKDVVGPYNEGSHLTLVCEAEGGHPRPSLAWSRDGVLLDDSWLLTPQGVVRNEFTIMRLRRDDLMATFTCTATNSNKTKPVSSSITLDLNLRPLDVRITSVQRPLSAGHKTIINCQSTGSRPPAVVTWWKGSKRLSHMTEDVQTQENVTLSQLQFTPSVEDDGHRLSCRADHALLPDSALEDFWILNVYYAPKLTISLGANQFHDQVREGSDVIFECHAQANPKVSSIGWHFDGRPLTNSIGSGQEILIRNHSLIVKSISKEQSGRYKCISANVEGEGHSHDVHLKVLYAPICKPNQKRLYGVATREPIQVPCDVDADPKHVSFRWLLNNSVELHEIKNHLSNGLSSIANYSPRTKYGYGQLYCYARNAVGEQAEPCVFDVIAAGPPNPVYNCLVGNQSEHSLVIKCEAGIDGGLEQQFFLEVYYSGRGRLHNNLTSKHSPVFDVQDLPMSTAFVLVLYAANAKGRSNSVALTANTTPFRHEELAVVTPVLLVLIGIVGSLTFVAFAVMVLTKVKAADKPDSPSSNRNASNCPLSRQNSIAGCNGQNSRDANQAADLIRCSDRIASTPYGMESMANEVNENWDRVQNETKFGVIRKDDLSLGFTNGDVHLGPRSTPDGDRCDSNCSTSGYPSNSKIKQQLNSKFLDGSSTILRDSPVVILNDDEPRHDEALINGLYYPNYASRNRNATHKKVTPLSTPV